MSPFNLKNKYKDIKEKYHPDIPIREKGSERPGPFQDKDMEIKKNLFKPFLNIQIREITDYFKDKGLTPDTIEEFNKTNAPDVIEEFLIRKMEDGEIIDPETIADEWYEIVKARLENKIIIAKAIRRNVMGSKNPFEKWVNDVLNLIPIGNFRENLFAFQDQFISDFENKISPEQAAEKYNELLEYLRIKKASIDERLPKLSHIEELKSELSEAAQKVYDEWEQDEEGNDFELGSGGICQDIAQEISEVLSEHGIDNMIVDNCGMGEQHVWVHAKTQEGVIYIDIPYHIYETGSGYNWKKIHDVKFKPEDIVLDIINTDPNSFDLFTEF